MAAVNIESPEIHYIDQELNEKESGVLVLPKPGKPRVWIEERNRNKNVASISLKAPNFSSDNPIETFTIKYKHLGREEQWKEKHIPAPAMTSTTRVQFSLKLEPNKTFIISVKACYENGTSSEWSDYADDFTIDEAEKDEERPPSPKDKIIKSGKPVSGSKKPTTYQIQLKQTYFDTKAMIRKYEYGEENPGLKVNEKVIMLVGATGSGKSTLINVMINYWFGIERNSDARLRLVNEEEKADQSESQTKYITGYTIHSEGGRMKVPNTTLTIIDTPGFGDTEGTKRDEEITQQIHKFFKSADETKVDHIDAVGFVTQASLPRLTSTQKYIFERILFVFGKDIEENILMLLTFADTQKPQVLSGLEKYGMKFKQYFKFNNSAIFTKNEEGDDIIENRFWDMGEDSFERLFRVIDETCEPKSLTLSQAVLDLREELEANITQIQTSIKIGLNDLEKLRLEMETLKKHEKAIMENKDFEYLVEEEVMTKRPSNKGVRHCHCIKCNRTCHFKCTCLKTKKCRTMDADGKCTTCPKNCSYGTHKFTDYSMVPTRRKVMKTYNHLKSRYQDGMQGRTAKMDLMQVIKEEFEANQNKTLLLAEQNRQAVQQLNHIALKPISMSTTDFIDMMISTEKFERKPGFRTRITELENLKERAELCADMLREDHDPFENQKDILVEFEKKAIELAKKKENFLEKTVSFFQRMKDGLLGPKENKKGEYVTRTTLVEY